MRSCRRRTMLGARPCDARDRARPPAAGGRARRDRGKHRARRKPKRPGGQGVGFDDAQRGGANQRDRLAGGVEKGAIARFDVAHAPEILHARLFGREQPALQIRDAFKTASDRHQALVFAKADGGVFDRQFASARELLAHVETLGLPADRAKPSSHGRSCRRRREMVSPHERPRQESRASSLKEPDGATSVITPSRSSVNVRSGLSVVSGSMFAARPMTPTPLASSSGAFLPLT